MFENSRQFLSVPKLLGKWFFAWCLCMAGVDSHAAEIHRTVDGPEDIVSLFEQLSDGRLVLGADDTLIITARPGVYNFSEYESSGNALPILTNARVIIRAESRGTAKFIGGAEEGKNYRFVHIQPPMGSQRNISLELEGISASNWKVEGEQSGNNGGFIQVITLPGISGGFSSKVTLRRCNISDVKAENSGGVIFIDGFSTNVVLEKSRFINVSAENGRGGVLDQTGSPLSISIDRLRRPSTALITNNIVLQSSSRESGGAFSLQDVELSVIDTNNFEDTFADSWKGSNIWIQVPANEQPNQRVSHAYSSISQKGDETLASDGGGVGIIRNNHFSITAGNTGDMMIFAGGGDNSSINVSNNTFSDIPAGGAAIATNSSSLVGQATDIALNVMQSVTGGAGCVFPFGGDKINSKGGNVASDNSCKGDGPGDVNNAEITFKTTCQEPFCGEPAAPSPAIDIFDDLLVAKSFPLGVVPCGYKDIRGLARPQDGDLDGIFGCDAGAYEVQGGPDVGAAQSAAYFDIAHNQEGYFAEMLAGGLVVIGVFTYKRDGTGPAWYTGVGQVVGNSFVVDDLILAKGGVFGADFDASNITRTTVAGFSANFPDCEATTNPGRWVIDPVDNISIRDSQGAVSDAELDTLLEEQIQVSSRIAQIIDCPAGGPAVSDTGVKARVEAKSPNAFRSGTYFDVARSGEGIFVQVLTDGTLVVMWYTFDPQGNPMWILATGTLVGNTATINARYPTQFTHFGSSFDPSEIVLSDWGTFTLTFTDCNTLLFSYASTVAAYGSSALNYTRLTQLAGTSCPA